MIRNVTVIAMFVMVTAAGVAVALLSVTNLPDGKIEVSGSTPIRIFFTQYGGLVPPDRARLEVLISDDGSIVVGWKNHGEITKTYTQNISRDDLEDLAKRLVAGGFYSLKARYTTPEGVVVADAGVAEITVKIGDREKTVIIDPDVGDYLPSNLREMLRELRSIVEKAIKDGTVRLNGGVKEAVETAKAFVTSTPTFGYDGIPETFTVTDTKILESLPEQYVVTIAFDSRHGGYGDRHGQVLAQVITSHTAVVTIVENKVISAILDRRWDELKQEPIQRNQGTISGRVTIGPFCPVEPCPDPLPDVYSSREIVLQPQGGNPIPVELNPDGTFRAQVDTGTYTLNLTDCDFLGCDRVLPKTVVVGPGEIAEIGIDIDTGIR